jgi:hypothetical protein
VCHGALVCVLALRRADGVVAVCNVDREGWLAVETWAGLATVQARSRRRLQCRTDDGRVAGLTAHTLA